MLVIGGDVGGTKTNVGLFDAARRDELGRDAPHLVYQYTYASGEYSGLADILEDFVGRIGARKNDVAAACVGIAGPVIGNRVQTPNLPWIVDGAALAERFRVKSFTLVNDLVATADGIAALFPAELAAIQHGLHDPSPTQTAALIAPGTGLGMTILAPAGDRWLPIASEGGHADLAPQNALEIELLVWLTRHYPDHVSYERVVCGPGITNCYDFLVDRGAVEANAMLRERVKADRKSAPRAITEAAEAGTCPVASAALDLFASVYGGMAGNMALIALATGGIFLGGGISPKIRRRLEHGIFVQAFCDKGRFRPLMETLPIRLILNPDTAMLGAARHAARAA
jgi:glucokinase